MQFVKTEDLKIGMRLARPIYSQKGVLLFERNSKLTAFAIDSVRNFGLLGIYILEPAEPLPPMSEEDAEFERFQTQTIFAIQNEIERILANDRHISVQTQVLAEQIIRKYGHLDGKINFYQNLRSREDYVYRHSFNVAVLCSLMCHTMNLRRDEQLQTVMAAIVHDIGKIQLGGDFICCDDLTEEEKLKVYNVLMDSADIIERAFNPNGAGIRRVCTQAAMIQNGCAPAALHKLILGARILTVANRYDELTAMTVGGETKSEVLALQELMECPEVYDPQVVEALIQSVNILFPGVSVELNTGDKALVLVENAENILRPTVLCFSDNTILDLSLKLYHDIRIVDIMKTLDNRYIMDEESLKKVGYHV